MNSENQQSVSLLCTNQCGFYGSPTTRSLCSKCYRDAIRKEQDVQQEAMAPQSNNASSDVPESRGTTLLGASSVISESAVNPLVVTGAASSPPTMLYKESDSRTTESPSSNNSNDHSNSCHSMDIAIDPEPLESNAAVNPDGAAAGVACVATPPNAAEVEKPEQVTRSRCWRCNKRVGLLGFQCRCGYFFCGAHRHANTHTCDFDYKTFEREQLSRANQKIVAEKVTKI